MSIEAMKQAIDALQCTRHGHCDHLMADQAIEALRAAIQQAESEPVGFVDFQGTVFWHDGPPPADSLLFAAKPVSHDKAKWCEYVAGMVFAWLEMQENLKEEGRCIKAITGIIERRMWALPTTHPAPGVPTVPASSYDRLQALCDDQARRLLELEDAPSVFLVRDIASLLGASVPEVCNALADLGYEPRRSTNAAISPDEAIAVAKRLTPAPGVPDAVVLDAERYRWLRENGTLGFSGAPSWRASVSFDAVGAYAQTLDSNIDAARA